MAQIACSATSTGWDLVAAAQRGDRDAFGVLYGRYVPVVAGYVRRRIADSGLVEDLTSETFTRAWRAIASVHDQGRDVGAWLVTIARNLVCDHVKSHRTQHETPAADVAALAEDRPRMGSTSGVEQLVLARQAGAELGQHVAALPGRQRAVIRLRFGHELSIRQTAAVLDLSEGAVTALQHRAITRLRTQCHNARPGGGVRHDSAHRARRVPHPPPQVRSQVWEPDAADFAAGVACPRGRYWSFHAGLVEAPGVVGDE